MCAEFFEGLFGGKPAIAAAPATAAVREKRDGGVVKGASPVAAPAPIAGGGNTNIGTGVGQSDGLRKRTTELGL